MQPENNDCEKKKYCPCFKVFLRNLLKYLKENDVESFRCLQQRVKVYSTKTREQELRFEHAAWSLMQEIPEIVPAYHLRMLRMQLREQVQQKKLQKQHMESLWPVCKPADTSTIRCNVFGVPHQRRL